MKTLLLVISVLFVAIGAQANDSATPYIEVQGVNPNGHSVGSSFVKVYGGELKEFFDVLPTVNGWTHDEFRQIQFVSNGYIGSLSCTQQYNRPTNGQKRYDHMCTFQIYENNDPTTNPASPSYDSDSYTVVNSTLGHMNYSNLDVLGIFPSGVKLGTEVYSFYGKQAGVVGQRVVPKPGSAITMTSGKYRLTLACQYGYQDPIRGWIPNNYKCSIQVDNK